MSENARLKRHNTSPLHIPSWYNRRSTSVFALLQCLSSSATLTWSWGKIWSAGTVSTIKCRLKLGTHCKAHSSRNGWIAVARLEEHGCCGETLSNWVRERHSKNCTSSWSEAKGNSCKTWAGDSGEPPSEGDGHKQTHSVSSSRLEKDSRSKSQS